ncbi:MAG: hypothetical protein AB7P44_14770 [Steroidobacteraceae bacterium]
MLAHRGTGDAERRGQLVDGRARLVPQQVAQQPLAAFAVEFRPLIAPWVGSGPLQDAVATSMIEAFSSFAAVGRPSARDLPDWPAFRAPGKNVMLLGVDGVPGRISELPKYAQLGVLDSLAAKRP